MCMYLDHAALGQVKAWRRALHKWEPAGLQVCHRPVPVIQTACSWLAHRHALWSSSEIVRRLSSTAATRITCSKTPCRQHHHSVSASSHPGGCPGASLHREDQASAACQAHQQLVSQTALDFGALMTPSESECGSARRGSYAAALSGSGPSSRAASEAGTPRATFLARQPSFTPCSM